MIVYVDNNENEYPACPLRSDLNTCKVVNSSKVNDCPNWDTTDDGDSIYRLPDYCPLKSGDVYVKLKDSIDTCSEKERMKGRKS